jgi:pyruvate/2-oxoglutarate dehydrogenase complex dihydrolipoamide acyltransferase (E2) component
VSSSTTEQSLVDVTMPQMGTSMSEGTIVAWRKEVGETVALDEIVCEISTDKIDTECPSPAAGRLVEILVGADETVDVGTVLARIAVEDGAALPAAAAGAGSGPAAGAGSGPAAGAGSGPAAGATSGGASAPAPSQGSVTDGGPAAAPDLSRRYSPVVRRIAAEHRLDLSLVQGSGRGGRVTKRDVLAWLQSDEGDGARTAPREPLLHSDSPYRSDLVPPAAGRTAVDDLGGVAEPLSRIRRSIGAAMMRSQQMTATCHTVVECDFSAVERRRREMGMTALPLVARAAVDVLREYPDLNATVDGDTITRYGERVHLGIAVSLGDEGLIVPVLHDAQQLSAEGLSMRIRELAKRARAKQLRPDDVQGASFTITSPGAFGAVVATPVIDHPQVAILDMEAIVKRPVVVTDAAGEDAIAIRPMANFVLGWDHRAMDGVYAARFLTSLREAVERLAA